MTNASSKALRTVLTDLWRALRRERSFQIMFLFLILSLVCWQIPIVNILLYPFRLFVTIVHEASHALMTILTGGRVASLTIAMDESGLTRSLGGFRPLVIMAGYLGSSIFGGLLIYFGRTPRNAKFVLFVIGAVIIALSIFYSIGNLIFNFFGGAFSLFAMLAIGTALIFIARKANDEFCHLFLLVLAVQTSLNALVDIQTLFFISMGSQTSSDAQSMAAITFIPAAVWSVLWGIMSLVILVFFLWISYKNIAPEPQLKIKSLNGQETGNKQISNKSVEDDLECLKASLKQKEKQDS